MNNILLNWKEDIEAKFKAEYELKEKIKDVENLKKLVLNSAYNIYNCKYYPKFRYNLNNDNATIKNANLLITSGFFTKDEIFAFIDQQIKINDLEPYKEEKENE